jgi:hypothetical protein
VLWGLVLALGVTQGRPVSGAPAALDAEALIRAAETYRGFSRPYTFVASVRRRVPTGGAGSGPETPSSAATVVEVRSDGFEKQLIFVRAPRRGDVLLKIGDTMWLRPRRLHRLTRLSPELRMFSGAAISDVTAVDMQRSYRPEATAPDCRGGSAYVLELTAAAPRTRYPRARYRIGCDDHTPQRIDFLAGSGKLLKTVLYRKFGVVLGRRIATDLDVQDHVLREASVVEMSDFAFLPERTLDAYTPGYLLSLSPAVD